MKLKISLLNIKDIEEKKCQRNTVKENANIIRDSLQPDIINAFGINKSKKNKLDSDNTNLNFCEQISLSVQKECYICRKLDSNISGKLIITKFGCNIHINNWVCKKYKSHWKMHLLEHWNI